MNRIVNKLLKEVSYQSGAYTIPPEFVSLVITMRCNFRCRSCSIWKKTNHDELDEASWKKIVEKLAKTLKPNTFIEINGGEALIKKELVLFLIKELKKHFKQVALNSNGLLINAEILTELKQAGLDLLKLSFYSLDETVHNDLRGHNSAYSHAKRAIQLINEQGIALEIGLLLTSKNIQTAPALIKYLQALPNTSIILQPLDEEVESTESKDRTKNKLITELWPTRNEVDNFFDWVVLNHQKIKNSLINIQAIRQYYTNPKDILKYRCFAGQRNLVIYPNGNVALCFKGSVVGNIHQQELEVILKQATGERKKIKHCQKYCRIVGCNFSRGLKEVLRDKFKK